MEGLFALTLAALIVFAIAQTNAIVTLNLRGYHNEATLWKALVATWQAGETLVASLAGLTVLVA
ncbi:MAG TPA: paraquat-inducible protein A, partial [Burkholderiaceae bacterium]|nr:paraquat-inducible protein A [Burkholderiaceae bacterium]